MLGDLNISLVNASTDIPNIPLREDLKTAKKKRVYSRWLRTNGSLNFENTVIQSKNRENSLQIQKRTYSVDNLKLKTLSENPAHDSIIPLSETKEESPIEPKSIERRTIAENRKLLVSSFDIIQRLNELPADSPDSPRLSETAFENLRAYSGTVSLPLDSNELDEYQQYHLNQINDLKLKLIEKESEITDLSNLLNQRSISCHHEEATENLLERFEQIEREVNFLKINYMQSEKINKMTKQLFLLDEGDPNRSIENFYYMTLNKITAFAIAIQSLSSGLVERNTSWKDDISWHIFVYLNNVSQILGAAGDCFFGAGTIIPLITVPIFTEAEYAVEKYRDWNKKREFQQAVEYFSGGLEGIESKNRNIAYGLTYLLQMQLRYCHPKGAEKIVEDWLYRLCYNLMKGSKSSEDIGKINSVLTHIFKGKDKKHTIKTYGDRKWTTKGLFSKAGIAYYAAGEWHYESCYRPNKKHSRSKELTNAKKYGYLFFSSEAEAQGYKNSFEKAKKDGISFIWVNDHSPQGPQVLLKDKDHITSPTLLPTIIVPEEVPLVSHDHIYPPVSPEVQKLKNEVKILQEGNQKLEDTVRLIKEQVQGLIHNPPLSQN